MTDEIIALDQAWEQAIIDEDVASMRRLAADDLVYTHSNCVVHDKEAFVSYILNGPIDFQTVRYEDVETRLHGDMALLTYSLHKTYALKADGRQDELHFRSSHVWIRQDGRWQLLANHATRIPDTG